MGFNTVSHWIKIALICLLLGAILFVIGFATNAWAVIGASRFGLWTAYSCNVFACSSGKITSAYLDANDWTVWYRATQVFECIGLIFVLLAVLVMLIFVFLVTFRRMDQQKGIIACCFIAVVAMVIGFAIFGSQFEEKYGHMEVGWSMGIAIAGCILTFIAGVMTLVDLRCSYSHSESSHTTMRVTTTRHITVRN